MPLVGMVSQGVTGGAAPSESTAWLLLLSWGWWLLIQCSPLGAGLGNGVAVEEHPRVQVEVHFKKEISHVRMALFLFLESSD